MTQDRIRNDRMSREMPRQVRLSHLEVGLAVAVTFAAVVQLITAMSHRENSTGMSSAIPTMRPAP